MAPGEVLAQIRTHATRVAGSYGLDVFDVQYRREAGGWVVRVQLDRPGASATTEESVSIGDCEQVSRDLSAILDVEDLVPSAYTLEVSSPGLDRPLRVPDDYRRFAGRRAKIVTRERVDGQTCLLGRLGGVESGDILLIDTDDGRRHRVPFGIVTRANLEVEF